MRPILSAGSVALAVQHADRSRQEDRFLRASVKRLGELVMHVLCRAAACCLTTYYALCFPLDIGLVGGHCSGAEVVGHQRKGDWWNPTLATRENEWSPTTQLQNPNARPTRAPSPPTIVPSTKPEKEGVCTRAPTTRLILTSSSNALSMTPVSTSSSLKAR